MEHAAEGLGMGAAAAAAAAAFALMFVIVMQQGRMAQTLAAKLRQDAVVVENAYE